MAPKSNEAKRKRPSATSDSAIRNAKPEAKPYKMFAERGLFLLIQPSGGKLWRLKYRHLGKEKKLSLGRYPDVSLKRARERRDEARVLLADGIDPAEAKARRLDESVPRQHLWHRFEVVI